MRLTAEEQAMLDGARGEAVRDALAYQVRVGEFFGAERFVPITNAHMMGDIEVMGDGGFRYLAAIAEKRARCAVPITTNARCVDFAFADRLGQDRAEVEKERRIIERLRAMNVLTTDTCINYQTLYQPHLGEHVAWGDTGTVIYANSVFGARTNFESGPAALAAAITGRTPEYGFHLDRHRKGTFVVRLDARLDDLADWGAVGKLVGESHQSYYAVPVFTGVTTSAARRRTQAPRRRARELRLDGHVPHGGRDARSTVGRRRARRQRADRRDDDRRRRHRARLRGL